MAISLLNSFEEDKKIYKKALYLAIPMMVQNGITNAVGLVDNLMVGSLSTESMTAVSVVGQLIFVFNLAIFGGLSGPGIYGAQYYGQGNTEGMKNIFRLKIWVSALILSIGLAIFGLFGINLVGAYLKGSAEGIDAVLTLKYGLDYLHIMMFGLLPFIITQIYAGSLRETGESILPMVAGLVSVAVDVVFNALLINGLFFFPRLEVKGAAIATVMARIVEMMIVVIVAHNGKKQFAFLKGVYSTLKIELSNKKTILVKSFPIFANEFFWAGGMAMLTVSYSIRGIYVIAGLNISNAICNLLNVVFIAMGNAVGIIIGQYLGASKFDEAKKYSTKLMWFTGGLCLILTFILIGLSGIFPKFYNTSQEVKDLGRSFIIINALFFPVQGYLNALYFTLRSGGKTVITFLFDSAYTWVVAVSIAYILCKFTSLNILMVFTIVQMADFLKVLIGQVLIKKGVWLNNLVES